MGFLYIPAAWRRWGKIISRLGSRVRVSFRAPDLKPIPLGLGFFDGDETRISAVWRDRLGGRKIY